MLSCKLCHLIIQQPVHCTSSNRFILTSARLQSRTHQHNREVRPPQGRARGSRISTTMADSEDEFGDLGELQTYEKIAVNQSSALVRRGHTFENAVIQPTYRTVKLRIKSLNEQVRRVSATELPGNLGPKTWDQIMIRLKLQGLVTVRIREDRFLYLLPNVEDEKQTVEIFQTLATQPMLVTPAMLDEVLNLELSDRDSPPSEDGHHFYVRSWQLLGEEITDIIDYLHREEHSFEEMENWKEVVRINAGMDIVFTIRYIGMCEGPVTPWERYNADTMERTGGMLSEFQSALDFLFPNIERAAVVYEIVDAYMPYTSQVNADDSERVLIEYFSGPSPTLLNRQRGGKFSSWLPDIQDVTNFQVMNTSFYEHFTQLCHPPQLLVRRNINEWAVRIQQYANANPAETGTARHRFTDDIRDNLLQQAMPNRYFDYTLMVFVGKDITFENYVGCRTFLGGRSQAGSLTRDFLRRLCQTEAENNGRIGAWDDMDFDPGFYPFVDLWHTLWHRKIMEWIVSTHMHVALSINPC